MNDLAPNLLSTLLCLLLLSLSYTAHGQSAATATDVVGAQDPQGLERFAFSQIVEYRASDEIAPREFIVSPVEKKRSDVRIKRKVRLTGTLTEVTYRVPNETPLGELIDHYRAQLAQDTVFSCRGLDCGRSNQWANSVFRLAKLYGPDVNQYYLAAKQAEKLVAVYIIQRGNKRIYAHVAVYTPQEPVTFAANANLGSTLAEAGRVVIEAVNPRSDGTLSQADQDTIVLLGTQLASFQRNTVFVVCHLYGASNAAVLFEASERCAQTVSELLVTNVSAAGPELIAHGVGSLAPGRTGAVSRIELILPHRLPHPSPAS